MGSITTSRLLVVGGTLLLAACARPHISPIAPPPYRGIVEASYDKTWKAIIRSLARQNLPLRAVARDSGVIATDDFVTPINLYADCGQVSGEQLQGESLVSFTIFVEPEGDQTRVQVNAKMRSRGSAGWLRARPAYQCASTDKFEANLLDAVRELVRE